MILKICNFKKRNRDRKSKTIQTSYRSKYRNKMELNCCYRTKVDSKKHLLSLF